MGQRVLIVEDEPAIAEILSIALRAEGFEPHHCADGLAAMDAFHQSNPDIVLLDLMLPGRDGIDICRSIREESSVPIIMLTARSDTQDELVGYKAGADDYMIKPLKHNMILIAKMQALLRRIDSPTIQEITIGDLTIDMAGHTVRRGEDFINLTVLEFKLLATLARKPWQVYTREQLLEDVWEYRHAADTRLVNVHVQRLRAKVERDPERPEIVLTVRGVGYKAGTV